MKNSGANITDMQSESEEAEVKLNVSIQKEDVMEEKSSGTDKTIEIQESVTDKEQLGVYAFGKQTLIVSQTPQNSQHTNNILETQSVENRSILQEKEEEQPLLENTSKTETKETQEQEDDLQLIFELKNDGDEKLDDQLSKQVNKEEESSVVRDEQKNGINEKEEIQNKTQIINDSCSVDIVESTTSEITGVPEPVVQSETQKDQENINDPVNNDASFVSYDSSILLKDVKVRLNDCLKENSKLFDTTNEEEIMASHFPKDVSFGKTLRNISGRLSINRMRHITCERRISPNSSLFVNTSVMSPQDDGAESKILYYNTGLSDSFPTNGSSYECNRKRKLDTPSWDSTKKQKTERSLLSSPINLLKSLRRPVQVSTPNVTSYKLETKLDISGIKDDDNKVTTEPTESTKKWCVVM